MRHRYCVQCESIIYLTSKFQTKMILWTHGVSTVTYLDNGYMYVRVHAAASIKSSLNKTKYNINRTNTYLYAQMQVQLQPLTVRQYFLQTFPIHVNEECSLIQ